jgi:hypothetical protein
MNLWETGSGRFILSLFACSLLAGNGLQASVSYQDPGGMLTDTERQALEADLQLVPANRVAGLQGVVIAPQADGVQEVGVDTNNITLYLPQSRQDSSYAFGQELIKAMASYATDTLMLSTDQSPEKDQYAAWAKQSNFGFVGGLPWKFDFDANYSNWYGQLQRLLTSGSIAAGAPAFAPYVQKLIFIGALVAGDDQTSSVVSIGTDPPGVGLNVTTVALVKSDTALTVGDYTFRLSGGKVITEIDDKDGNPIAPNLSIGLAQVTLDRLSARTPAASSSSSAAAQRRGQSR